MKITLGIICSFLFVPLTVFAVKDANLNAGTDIIANGVTVSVSKLSTPDTITVNSGNFTIDLGDNDTLEITSSDRYTFTTSPATYVESFTCGDSNSTLILKGPADVAVTITVTPQATVCTAGGSSSGGGGGGGGIVVGTAVGIPEPQFVVVRGDETVVLDTPPTEVTITETISGIFYVDLRNGSVGPDVLRLQKLLNSDPDTQIALTGNGSLGNESDYFGGLTEAAVRRFQTKHGIASSETEGFGVVGPVTRALLQGVFGEAMAVTTTPLLEVSSTPLLPPPLVSGETTTETISAVFDMDLSNGDSGPDVLRLQKLLNSDPDTQIALTGNGSLGNESDYFGGLTEAAVQRFQAKYGIISSGDPATTGFGAVGPVTRALLQGVFNGALSMTKPASLPTATEASGMPTLPPAPPAPPTTETISAVFDMDLSNGDSGPDVLRLQKLLNSDPDTQIALTGNGSLGNESDYFGGLTEAAVQRFQAKYGIISSGDPATTGFGAVGPVTRALLQGVFGG